MLRALALDLHWPAAAGVENLLASISHAGSFSDAYNASLYPWC